MKNWQKPHNYRRMRDENGNVIANVITVFREKIEVSDELFTMYAHMDAHERYIMEEAPRGRVFSLDKMAEDDLSAEAVYFENIPMREYARRIGVSYSMIAKRHNRILYTLKKSLRISDFSGYSLFAFLQV